MSKDENNYYVATAIPYVNDVPHIGHALEAVQADIFARYHKQQGKRVFFSYGTDEHGVKIANKAKEKQIEVKQYVDDISATFKDMTTLLNVEYSKFIRTTDPEHEKIASKIFTDLGDDIYLGKYKGMYDWKEEEFLSEEQARIIKNEDPKRYERLEPVEEENYFFKLSKYTDQIKQAIESNELKIFPATRRNEILALLNEGLTDISVSRPKEKLDWGIPVPTDENHTMYVWVEALTNYITTLGYPEGDKFKKYWPCDAHVIGKDISRFHCAIWPAMLLSLGIELPKAIYIHGFINIEGEKMSKSIGNVVSPFDMVNKYSADITRYYLTRHIPTGEDGDFSWVKFENAYNGELGNDLGNLVQRVASMINKYQAGKIGEIPESNHDISKYHVFIEDYRFDRALDFVFTLIKGLNQYIDTQQPWKIAKEDDPEHLREVLAEAVSGILQVADLLIPFIPESAQKIIQIFASGEVNNQAGPLFPKIYHFTEEKQS